MGRAELDQAKLNALNVAKKTVMDLLAKCYQNTSIKEMVGSLIELMNLDENLCVKFMEQCFKED
jgi:hypothetical protein